MFDRLGILSSPRPSTPAPREKHATRRSWPKPQDTTAAAFCQEIKLQFYPTFMFFGAGKFHDHDPLSGVVLSRPTEHDSTAKVRREEETL